MEITLVILQLLTILEVGFKDYISAYFKKKGENLATKEDIEEITDKIESVKKVYDKKLEEIKAILNFQGQQRLRIFDKRTEAALQFYEDSFMLADQLVAPFHFRYEDIDQLDKLIVETRLRMARVQASFHRLRIYVEPSRLIEAAAEVSDAVSGVSQRWYDVILKFRQAFAQDGEEYSKSGQVTNNHSYLAGQTLRQFVTPYAKQMEEGLGALCGGVTS